MRKIYLLYFLTLTLCNELLGKTPVANLPPLSLSSTTVPDTCDLSQGSVNLSVSGGVAPYTYSWSNGETTEDLNDVLPGAYTVTVTDANGETATHTATVNASPIPFTVVLSRDVNRGCNGDNNGSIVAFPLPPNSGYTYLWSNGETTQGIYFLGSGFNTVTVTLGNCTVVAGIMMKSYPIYPVLSASPVKTTCDLPNGSIDLNVQMGPYPPYTFLWSNGETTEDLVDLLAGTYTVTVTADNSCTAVLTVYVTNTNPPININSVIFSNTSCVQHNGNININVSPADTYTYNWSTGDTSEDLFALSPGSYAVTVSRIGTCTATATFEVLENIAPVDIIISTTDASCGQSNGSLFLTLSTNLPPPYLFNWEDIPGINDPKIRNNLSPGTYFVTVTGINGCTAQAKPRSEMRLIKCFRDYH